MGSDIFEIEGLASLSLGIIIFKQWIFTNKPNMTSHAERVLNSLRTRESAGDSKQNSLNGVEPG